MLSCRGDKKIRRPVRCSKTGQPSLIPGLHADEPDGLAPPRDNAENPVACQTPLERAVFLKYRRIPFRLLFKMVILLLRTNSILYDPS